MTNSLQRCLADFSRASPTTQTPPAGKCFARMDIPLGSQLRSRLRSRLFVRTVFSFRPASDLHLTLRQLPNIIVCTSLLWRADKLGEQAARKPGFTDGAKIYFCYRRCCFLTWKRRSSLLDRLPPRKSRFQSYPSEMRSVSQRRSRHDESVSAWRSLCH